MKEPDYKCPIFWEVGDAVYNSIEGSKDLFLLGTVVEVTQNGWPIVKIMKDLHQLCISGFKIER